MTWITLPERKRPHLGRLAAEMLLARLRRDDEPPPPPPIDERHPYYDDPVGYARDKLGLQLWSRQVEILEAIRDHDRVAIRSGHKCGKTLTLIAAALWFVDTRGRGARCPMTSASGYQVRKVLWGELRERVAMSVGCAFPEPALIPSTGMQWPDNREIVGFSTKEPERAAGTSAPEMLFILDEASGIPDEIFEAIEGNRAGGAKVILASNPTKTVGAFFDAFHSKRKFWHTIHVSCEETPNVIEGRRVVRGLATREWVEEKREEWRGDARFEVRVLGNFPSQSSRSVISLGMIEDAKNRHADGSVDKSATLHFGLDVARFGDDDSVLVVRRGKRVLAVITEHGFDTVEVAGLVARALKDHRQGHEEVRIKIDSNGVGAGVADQVRANAPSGVQVIDVNAGERAPDEENFALVRDQLWWSLREWYASGAEVAEDAELEQELLTPEYSLDVRGRIKVESKDSMRKRLGRSPDRADALALAVWEFGADGGDEDFGVGAERRM